MKNIFKTMVELQHKFNEETIENYLDKNLNWNSAIIAESGELLNSLGYKWWKKQVPDMENVKVEAIDLLHFVISESIQFLSRDRSIKYCINSAATCFYEYFEELETYDTYNCTDLETMISHLNYDEYDRFFIMKKIFKALNMSNEDVYIAYIVKYCLNKFRQDNGYKIGTYIKDWNGKEDNVVAYSLANIIGVKGNLFDELYETLSSYYNKEVKKDVKDSFQDDFDYFKTQKVN